MISDLYLPEETPDGRTFWLEEEQFTLDKDGFPIPALDFSVVSNIFFGRSVHWLKYGYTHYPHIFVLDGEKIRYRYKKNGRKFFSLADIERVAFAIYENTPHFKLQNLFTTITLVKYTAFGHGYLTKDGYQVYPEDIPRPWKNVNKERNGS